MSGARDVVGGQGGGGEVVATITVQIVSHSQCEPRPYKALEVLCCQHFYKLRKGRGRDTREKEAREVVPVITLRCDELCLPHLLCRAHSP